MTNLDISHSAASATDMSELFNALATNTSVKSVNAEFCKLEDNDALCSAIENLLRSNNTLRKLNFDGTETKRIDS